jgi:purine-binding chemotaxis protein CheW
VTGGGGVRTVVFSLDAEMFAFPAGTVREILDYREGFRMPRGPAWLSGLIDVRGSAEPMVDLRLRLVRADADDPHTLVIDVPKDDRVLTLGLVANCVLDVSDFLAEVIMPRPTSGPAGASAT